MTFFDKSRAVIISLTLFLFPLIFLPVTTEFYATNKQYLLVITASLLLMLGIVEVIGSKKTKRGLKIFDVPALLLVLATGASVLLVSPNKPAAALEPATGLISIAALAVLYFFLSRERHEAYLNYYATILQYAVVIICIIELGVFILSHAGVTFPQSIPFLGTPLFTPLGSIVDLMAFLGFFFVYTGIRLFLAIGNKEAGASEVFMFSIVTVALGAASITYFQTPRTDIPYAPFEYSLRTIPIVMQSPLTAVFGYGTDNFAALFTRAKDVSYATSQYAPIATFTYARSALLQTLSTAGLFGAVALLIIFLRGLYESFALPKQVRLAVFGLFIYIFIAFVVFPPSLVLFFLLFVTLGLLNHDILTHSHRYAEKEFSKNIKIPSFLSSMIAVLLFAGLCWGGYILASYYRADLSFRRSARSITNRNLSETYAEQYNAILLNPYQEKYHTSFAQTNLYIANQIAQNSQSSGAKLSEADRDTVTNAIKTAIEESRAATVLNPQKATNWENRGRIYKNLLNVAEKADSFAIASYERAILADPFNPSYRNDLGEVYYLTKQYKEAAVHFSEALELRPHYSNARYNLAWAYFQMGQKEEAINQLQQLMDSLSTQPDSPEYKKALADLERFKK